MKNPTLTITIAAACAAAFVGCEWGGVHSGESWNDAYSWANFTGTYKFVSAVQESSDSTSSEESSSTDISSKTVADSKAFPVSQDSSSTTYHGLKTPVVPGSVTVSCGSLGWTFKDDVTEGVLTYKGSSGTLSGTVDYTTGTITINHNLAHGAATGTINYSYTVQNATTSTTSGTTTTVSSPITWLNLTQQGNLLTFLDNNNVTYSGKITGASCPKASEGGYMPAGHIRFTFEAKSNGGATISGAISGDWSGASSATTGTLANRTIDATYHSGKTSTQFQAVSGTTTISAKEIAAAVGTTE